MLTDATTGGHCRMFTFLSVFKGKKLTSYTFQLDSKHLSIHQRSGAFTVLDPQEEKHPVPEENGFRGFLLFDANLFTFVFLYMIAAM